MSRGTPNYPSLIKNPATTEAMHAPFNAVMDGTVQYADVQEPRRVWPDPTPEMLTDPRFEAIWNVIKGWDINVPGAYSGFMGATGNHARAILDALDT